MSIGAFVGPGVGLGAVGSTPTIVGFGVGVGRRVGLGVVGFLDEPEPIIVPPPLPLFIPPLPVDMYPFPEVFIRILPFPLPSELSSELSELSDRTLD